MAQPFLAIRHSRTRRQSFIHTEIYEADLRLFLTSHLCTRIIFKLIITLQMHPGWQGGCRQHRIEGGSFNAIVEEPDAVCLESTIYTPSHTE